MSENSPARKSPTLLCRQRQDDASVAPGSSHAQVSFIKQVDHTIGSWKSLRVKCNQPKHPKQTVMAVFKVIVGLLQGRKDDGHCDVQRTTDGQADQALHRICYAGTMRFFAIPVSGPYMMPCADQHMHRYHKLMRHCGLQDDLLYETLTVYETLYFAAMLRLPKYMTRADKIERVNAVISSLGLERCRDTIIGGELCISQGTGHSLDRSHHVWSWACG